MYDPSLTRSHLPELRIKVGPKGQILIPKIFRERYGLKEGGIAVMESEESGVLIRGRPSREIKREIEHEIKPSDAIHGFSRSSSRPSIPETLVSLRAEPSETEPRILQTLAREYRTRQSLALLGVIVPRRDG